MKSYKFDGFGCLIVFLLLMLVFSLIFRTLLILIIKHPILFLIILCFIYFGGNKINRPKNEDRTNDIEYVIVDDEDEEKK